MYGAMPVGCSSVAGGRLEEQLLAPRPKIVGHVRLDQLGARNLGGQDGAGFRIDAPGCEQRLVAQGDQVALVGIQRMGLRMRRQQGAIGQPRDNNPKAAYVVYDMDEGTIELRRLDYDIAAAQKKILDAGLPPRLAERLSYGR